MTYIEGYVLPIASANREAYRAYCERFLTVFREIGGSRMVEAWGDDIPEGKTTDFRRAAGLQERESVVYSWMEFADKKTRDAVFRKMRNDPKIVAILTSDLYDRQRMIHGGFEILSECGGGGPAGYIEGSLMPVPTLAKSKYHAWAKASNALFVKHGASRAVVAWPDAVPPEFKAAVSAEGDETVTYCWIEWPSKQFRAEAWTKIMADPAMQALVMPFEGSRMIFGGFEPILDG